MIPKKLAASVLFLHIDKELLSKEYLIISLKLFHIGRPYNNPPEFFKDNSNLIVIISSRVRRLI